MHAELRHLDGAYAGQTRTVRKEFATIGRHPSADVRFDAEQDLEVSGRHAAIFQQGSHWMLRDLGSTNGTWVNGSRLKGDRALEPNDVIRFGPKGPQLLFLPAESGAAAPSPTVPPTRREDAPAAPRVVLPAGSTTERIRVEARRLSKPWRRAALALALLALAGTSGAVLLTLRHTRRLEAERAMLLLQADQLLQRLEAVSSNVTDLQAALAKARGETQQLRGSLTAKRLSAARLDSLAQALAGSQRQHEMVLRAARLDAAAIARENGDAVGIVVSEFPNGARVAGTGFAVRTRGDSGWIVTSRHIVQQTDGTRSSRLGIIFNGSGQNFRAAVVATADSADLALLSVRIRGGVPVVRSLGPGTTAGEAVAIVGFPFGFDFPMGADWRKLGVSASSFTGTVRTVRPELIEVDGYGASGSSGSPLFNTAGEVIGVIYGGDPRAAGRIVYAVPVRLLRTLLGER